jgi:hypothetical protein
MRKIVNKLESFTFIIYEIACILTKKDSLPTLNAELGLYSLEFALLVFTCFNLFGQKALFFWISLIIVFIFNYYFMYIKKVKKQVRKKLKI